MFWKEWIRCLNKIRVFNSDIENNSNSYLKASIEANEDLKKTLNLDLKENYNFNELETMSITKKILSDIITNALEQMNPKRFIFIRRPIIPIKRKSNHKSIGTKRTKLSQNVPLNSLRIDLTHENKSVKV